jgi:hypothetical protein
MLNRDSDGARVAVVTGAAQDIGAAIGHELVQRGFRVVLGDTAESQNRATASAINRWGRLDIMVNNAARTCAPGRSGKRESRRRRRDPRGRAGPARVLPKSCAVQEAPDGIVGRRGSLLEAGTVRVALDDQVDERPPRVDREAERGGRAATAPRCRAATAPWFQTRHSTSSGSRSGSPRPGWR